MKTSVLKTALFGSALVLGVLTSCDKKNPDPQLEPSGPDVWERQWITLLASYPDDEGTAGNGGTMVYAVTPEEAINPNKTINIYTEGTELRSQRTARAQASANGNFIYNIQYTGESGGTFNKYRVTEGSKFIDTREEIDTEPILGQAPRWTVAAEGIGVGV